MASVATQMLDPLSNGIFTGIDDDGYGPFLGPLASQPKANPHEITARETMSFPEARRGRNIFLANTVSDWVMTANQTWYTTRAAPWIVTDEIHAVWTQREANAHFMEIEPERATSGLVTQQKMVRTATLIRYGIGALFEQGFLKTAMGRSSFVTSMGQIARAKSETINVEVVRQYVNAYKFQVRLQREYGVIDEYDLDKFLKRDRDRYALVQKTKNGMTKLDADVNEEMTAWGGSANAWMITADVAIYNTFVRDEVTDYWKAGPAGPGRINNTNLLKGVESANITNSLDRIEPYHMVRDSAVFIARTFGGGPAGEKIDLLARTRQHGEYNVMFDENSSWDDYTSRSRNIAIYNQNEDRFTKITLRQAIENCGRWTRDGKAVMPMSQNQGDVRAHDDDLDQDFMVFREGGQRKAVRYIGDIDHVFLGDTLLGNVGRTLANAAKKRTGRRAPSEAAVASVLGTENAMFGLGYSPDFANLGRVQITFPSNAARAERDNIEELPRDRLVSAFLKMLAHSVPAGERRDALLGLGVDASVPVLQRGEAIRDAIIDMVGENSSDLLWKNEAAVHVWFGKRVNAFNQKMAETPDVAPVASTVNVDTDATTGWAYPGEQLPEGWRYVNPAAANRTVDQSVRSAVIPTRPEHVPHIAAQMDARASRGARQAQSSSAGYREERAGGSMLGRVGMLVPDQHGSADKRAAGRDDSRETTGDASGNLFKLLARLDGMGMSDDEKQWTALYLGTPMTRDAMLKLEQNDVIVPMGFALFRNQIQERTRTVVKFQADGGAANSFTGNDDMQIQPDATTKEARAHFTTYMGVVVHTPRNVYVQHDVMVIEYQGGMGVQFWTPDEYKKTQNMERRVPKDIICVALPYTERDMPNPLDVSGRFYTEYKAGLLTREKFQRLHYSTAYFVNQQYGFRDPANLRAGVDQPNLTRGRQHRNRVCWQGMQYGYNEAKRDFSYVRVNTGHWGRNVYQGVAAVREARKTEQLAEQDYSRFTIM